MGTVVGAAVGAVAGGLIGKGVAEGVNPSAEHEYWRSNYTSRPYAQSGYDYDSDYGPAYQYGWESRQSHTGRKFDEVESDLGRGWEKAKGKSRLAWEHAKGATRDAWDRVENKFSSNRASSSSSRNDEKVVYDVNDPDRRS